MSVTVLRGLEIKTAELVNGEGLTGANDGEVIVIIEVTNRSDRGIGSGGDGVREFLVVFVGTR